MEQSSQLVKRFPAIYETQLFIAVFTRARHWHLTSATRIQSTSSHHIPLGLIVVLLYHLYPNVPTCNFNLGSPTKI